LEGNSEILVAAAAREDLNGPVATEELARRAVAAAPRDPRAWFALGACIYNSEYAHFDPELPASGKAPDRGRVEESSQCFTKALEYSDKIGMRRFRLDILLHRIQTAHQMGNDTRMREDIDTARREGPDEPRVLLAYARMLEDKGDRDQAIATLRQVHAICASADTALLLGVNLWNRNASGDREEASTLLEHVAVQGERHAEPAAEFAIEAFLVLKKYANAAACLTSLQSRVDPALALALRARLALSQGDPEAGTRLALEALEGVSERTTRITLRCVAKALISFCKHSEALPLLSRLAVPGVADDDAYRYIDCAWHLERHGDILTFCKVTREAGVSDDRLLAFELNILDCYDPDVAIELLLDFANRRPEYKRIRLHLVTLALRSGRNELAKEHAATLPTVIEADAHDGETVVSVLLALRRFAEASEYAYDFLRRHFDDHRAHRAFWSLALFRERDTDVVVTSPTVVPGTAVNIIEDVSDDSHWFVLEDSLVPAVGVTDEIRADSSFAQKLLGKQRGDRVGISEGAGLSRWGTVRDIIPKHVFRFRDVLNRWQLRFPDQHEIWMVRLPLTESGEPDMSPMIEIMKDRQKSDRYLEEIYTNKLVSMHVFGQAINANEIGAMHHVAGVDGLDLKCCFGAPEEWSNAETALGARAEIVVTPTALATLLALEDFDILNDISRPLLVSQSTRVILRAFLEQVRKSHRAAESVRSADDPAAMDRGLDAAERLVALVDKHCQVLSCPAMAHLDPEERKRLVEGLGACEVESMLLASFGSRVLWTDDLVAAVVARNRFGLQRVWSQAVFRFAARAGRVDQGRHDRVCAKLVGFGYTFTSVNPEIVRAAGEMAEWGIGKWPLKQSLDYLAMPAVRPEDAARLGANIVAFGCRALERRESKRALVVEAAERLARRADGPATVQQFRKILPYAFGPVDIFNKSDAVTALATWWREYAARVVVVGGR
jgi:tetratricopeptide (TPR) repeat protein